MLVKKYYIDRVHFCLEDKKMHGDMGFSFCDMPETRCDSLDEAIECCDFAISESIRLHEINKSCVFIYEVYEYTFDTDKFEVDEDGYVDEDYEINSEAIVGNELVYALCEPCSARTFKALFADWKSCWEDEGINVNRYRN